ncbi:MAG: hypothetical protein OXH76_03840 [Boseongicola sp.]|nr:hypothetical protein [Boseongicola sp.]
MRFILQAIRLRAATVATATSLVFLLPVMSASAGASGPSTARAWLDAVEASLLEVDGRALQLLPVPGREEAFGTEDGQVFVFHSRLSTVWQLDAETVEEAAEAGVIGTASLLREETPEGGRILALWNGGAVNEFVWPLPLPQFEVASELHPLAVAHDALLSAPLARRVAEIPAGWRFRPDGLVLPEDPEFEVRTATLWRSDGHTVLVEHADGFVVRIRLEDLVRALGNEPADPAAAEGEGAN